MRPLHNRLRFELSEYKYPQEITENNRSQLVKQAKTVTRKASISLFLSSFIYGLITPFLVPLFLYLPDYVATTFPTMPPEALIATILLLFVLIIEVVLLFLYDLIERGISRLWKLDHRESVLCYCILIANYISNGERKKAQGEVSGFIASLLAVKRTTGRAFSQEIGLLTNGKIQMKRMFSFSEENIPQLFYSFGLALVNNDDPMAYRFIKQMINETQEYGKLEGLLERIENRVKSLKGVIAFVSSIVLIIATLWGIFG